MISSIHQPRPWFQLDLKDPELNAAGRWVCSQLKDLFSWVDTCLVIEEKQMCERFNCTTEELSTAIKYMTNNRFLTVEPVDGYRYLFRSQKRFGIFARRANSQPRPTADNYIYLMRDHSNGLTKIGRSNNPDVRENTLRSETPAIEMIASFESAPGTEARLHNLFSAKRKRGEWFDLSPSDIDHIVKDKFDAISSVCSNNQSAFKDLCPASVSISERGHVVSVFFDGKEYDRRTAVDKTRKWYARSITGKREGAKLLNKRKYEKAKSAMLPHFIFKESGKTVKIEQR